MAIASFGHEYDTASEIERELDGFRVGRATESLNAQCHECSRRTFEKSRRTVDRFREQHERLHEIKGCVVVWAAYSENPLSDDSARFLKAWLPQARAGYTLGWRNARHFSERGVSVARWTGAQP
jgi:hypothetical protein